MRSDLFLIYNYRGKQFVIAKDDPEIHRLFRLGKKLVIGSDAKNLWQIYDNKFPKKYVFVEKGQDSYFVNLQKNMSIVVSDGNKELTLEELKSKGLLKNNKLYLKEGYSGSVHINENTEIKFRFVRGSVALTEDQKRMVANFTKRPPLASDQKITRSLIFIVLILVIAFASYMNYVYEPVVKKSVFEQTRDNLKREMTVSAEVKVNTPTNVATVEKTGGEGEKIDETPQEVTPTDDQTTNANTMSNADALALISATQVDLVNQTMSTQNTQVAGMPSGGGGGGAISGSLISSTMSGLKGNNNRKTTINIGNVSTSTSIDDRINALAAGRGLDTGLAAVGAGGESVTTVAEGRATNLIASTDINAIKDYNANVGKNPGGGIEDTGTANVAVSGLPKTVDPKAIIEEPTVTGETAQQSRVKQWFTGTMGPQISGLYNTYKLTKPIRGYLDFTFKIVKGKVVKVTITGSIKDKKFINELRKILNKKTITGLVDYDSKPIRKNFGN